MRALALPALALLAGLAAGPVSAGEEEPDYGRAGPYLAIGGAWATPLFEDEIEDFASDLAGTPVDVDVDDTWTASALLGYRLFPLLAAEAQYEYVDEFRISASAAGISGGVDLSGHVLTGNLKLLLPLWRFQPYVLGGVGVVWYDASGGIVGLPQAQFEDEQAFAGRVGAGLDLYLTESLVLDVGATAVLTAEKISTDLDVSDVDGLHYVAGRAMFQVRF